MQNESWGVGWGWGVLVEASKQTRSRQKPTWWAYSSYSTLHLRWCLPRSVTSPVPTYHPPLSPLIARFVCRFRTRTACWGCRTPGNPRAFLGWLCRLDRPLLSAPLGQALPVSICMEMRTQHRVSPLSLSGLFPLFLFASRIRRSFSHGESRETVDRHRPAPLANA